MGAVSDELRIYELTKYGVKVETIPELKRLVKKIYAPAAKDLMIKLMNRIMQLEREQRKTISVELMKGGLTSEASSAGKGALTSPECPADARPRSVRACSRAAHAEPPSSPPNLP